MIIAFVFVLRIVQPNDKPLAVHVAVCDCWCWIYIVGNPNIHFVMTKLMLATHVFFDSTDIMSQNVNGNVGIVIRKLKPFVIIPPELVL